jgi:hypothetical protein
MNDESCILALSRDNTIFRLISVKSFYILDERIKLDPEPIRDSQEVEDDNTIIIDIADPADP